MEKRINALKPKSTLIAGAFERFGLQESVDSAELIRTMGNMFVVLRFVECYRKTGGANNCPENQIESHQKTVSGFITKYDRDAENWGKLAATLANLGETMPDGRTRRGNATSGEPANGDPNRSQ